MGSTYSTDNDEPDTATNRCDGFAKREAQHLSTLRSLVLREQQRQKSEESRSLLPTIWRCSHLLSLNATLEEPSSSSIGTASDIEAHLVRHAPSELTFVRGRCQQFELLLAEFTALTKMNASLRNIFTNDDHQFLERVSTLLGMHGNHSHASLEFVCDAVCAGACSRGTIPAKDAIELCFETASVLNFIILREQSSGVPADDELVERRDISAEATMMNSMDNSLLEYAKSSRDNDNYFGGYTGDPGATAAGGTGTSAAAAASTIAKAGQVTMREFSEWQRKVVPDLLHCSLTKFLQALLFPPGRSPSHRQSPAPFPIVRSSQEITSPQTASKVREGGGRFIMPISSHVFGENTASTTSNRGTATSSSLLSPPLFAFASISIPKFGEKWYRIFAGEVDGWTFQSLEHSILGYEGPTLLVIQARNNSSSPDDNRNSNKNKTETVTLGAYAASKWEKKKRDFFGSSDCFLFQLQPTLRVLKSLPKMGTRGGHYMYFHSNTNTNTSNPSRKDDLALGLGFGGTVRSPRLFIDSRLEECKVSPQDTSFEEGNLGLPPPDDLFSSHTSSSSSTLRIDSLEIYAVGDEETIRRGFKAQYQHRDIADATLRNARTVDKAAFLGDMRNGVIESKAFAHRGQVD
eukprot:CAMPEP_0181102156 /NCGR_PEP_ID=MMETSP1071-20121207/14157_1 /TAXON_ID=35127 /ORGANISM="Thalassiosira sp., Strain NH16" /LENGTH=633 /DNA_ID=CAMNT_0023185095 /DNA_START=67 /DNA_END=1965 /DNA_ORIENTATION=-